MKSKVLLFFDFFDFFNFPVLILARSLCLVFLFLLFLFLLSFSVGAKRVLAQVVINEVSPASSPEWVEIYNNGLDIASLENYVIYFDSSTDTSQKRIFCSSQTIDPYGFLVIEVSRYLNNDGDSVLLEKNGNIVDSVSYGSGETLPKLTSDQSGKRDPDGSENWVVTDTPTKNGEIVSFDCPTPVVTPTPTSTPQPSSTPNPTQSSATYTINKAKDNNDNLLSNVKIYIDGQYTGNYAEETYKFCDGCKCGSNKVDCGFGSHTFRLEKNGYDDWSKTENITAGGNLTVDPILSKNNSNTPTPTATKTPSPVKSKPPATELPDSSLSPNDDSSEEMVLGLRNDLKEEDMGTGNNEKKPEENKKGKPSVLGGILVFFGLLSLGYAGFYLYKRNKVEYKNGENTTEIGKEENEE